MNSAYSSLRSLLPERRAANTTGFPVEPRRVKAWVDALPRANHAGTLRLLVEALDALRDMPLDGVQRLTTLEALRPSLLDAIAQLETQLQGTSFPLPPAKEKVAEQILSLQHELALGYRMAVVEACATTGKVPMLRGGQVAQALERALFHGLRQQAASYYLYRTPEEGAWIGLHALYRFAQEASLADKASDEPVEKTALSPRQLYTHALLLALSNPYRFTQREQSDLWPLTRDLAAQVELDSTRRHEGAFAVPMSEDRGPGYLPEERVSDGQALLWVDLGALRTLFDAALDGAAFEGQVQVRLARSRTLTASADLLRRLRQSWGQAADRGHQRLGAVHTLDTVIGLTGLHYHLAGSLDFDTFMRDVRGVGAASDERAAWVHGVSTDAARVPTSRARVLDQSLGGYRLAWERAESVRARVGELIGLTPTLAGDSLDREARSWMVGVIRWLRYDPQGGVDAGVELLARRAYAVGLRSLDATGVPRAPLRGIQISHLRLQDAGAMHFLAPSVLDAQVPRIEVARAADPDHFEESQAQVSECDDLRVLENAGDYLLLAAQPAASAEHA